MNTKAVYMVAALLLAGCAVPGARRTEAPDQGIAGTVRLKPGYDASDMQFTISPPDLTPRPLGGAKVCLLRYPAALVVNFSQRPGIQPDFPVNFLKVVEIRAGEVTQQEVEIPELVPQ